MSASLLIHGVALFDGHERRGGRWTVVVRGDRIEKVVEADRASPERLGVDPRVARRVEVPGATLLPGLIDLHVHLVWDGSADPVARLRLDSPEQTLLRAVAHARRTLQAGITTVRDLGSVDDLAITLSQAIEAGWVEGPRVLASGQTIIMTGGHDPFWGIMVDGPFEARKAVRRQISRGAHVIKVSATGGAYGRPVAESVDDVELLPDELHEIVAVAHSFGRRVAAHAIGRRGIQHCIDAGVDTIEHGHYLTDEQAAAMAERGIAPVPTVYVYRQLADSPDVPAYAREKARVVAERHREAVARAKRHGVTIGAGTDAGSPRTPHPSLVRELECLVDCGLSTVEALRAATSAAARILGRDDLGRIEPGQRADLVLVEGDPAADLRALERVACVIQGGRVQHPALPPRAPG